jgi:hypothetical protein
MTVREFVEKYPEVSWEQLIKKGEEAIQAIEKRLSELENYVGRPDEPLKEE